MKGESGQEPDHKAVGKRRAKPEEDRLKNGSPDGDDERDHHRLGMARLQTVQGSQKQGRGKVNPRMKGSLLNELMKIIHIRNMPPWPLFPRGVSYLEDTPWRLRRAWLGRLPRSPRKSWI